MEHNWEHNWGVQMKFNERAQMECNWKCNRGEGGSNGAQLGRGQMACVMIRGT